MVTINLLGYPALFACKILRNASTISGHGLKDPKQHSHSSKYSRQLKVKLVKEGVWVIENDIELVHLKKQLALLRASSKIGFLSIHYYSLIVLFQNQEPWCRPIENHQSGVFF